jgi:hypothetical protein
VLRDGQVRVQWLPDPYPLDPHRIDLDVTSIKEGCDLHLMEEEAVVVAALITLAKAIRDGTPGHRPSTGPDGKHDIGYWLNRVAGAVDKAGYTLQDHRVARTYLQLADLLDNEANRAPQPSPDHPAHPVRPI